MVSEKDKSEAAADRAMPVRNPRQTLSYLSELLTSQGLRPRRQYGQNFLIDLNLLDLLVRAAPLDKSSVVLEVGSGTGGLTTRLAEVAGHVVSVEIDEGFYRLVQATLRGHENVTLIFGDILENKNRINASVLANVESQMNRFGVKSYDVVANFPYDVAASVIANLLIHPLPVRSLTFTVQLEVAERILAQPECKDYGPLSVLVQVVGFARLIRVLPPSAFWPRPKVQSAFVGIDIDPNAKARIPDLIAFHQFVRLLFIHRRKNLRGSILSVPDYKPLKEKIDDVLASIDLNRNLRAESLPPETLYRLFQTLGKSLA